MRYFSLLLLLFFVHSTSFSQNTKVPKPGVSAEMNKENRSPFRYVIVSDKLDPRLDSRDEDRRFVEVLLDPEAFSKENLTKLFELLRKRFPKPKILTVSLFTNLTDVETPEEREMTKFSDSPGREFLGDHAVFIRTDKKVFFYMYFSDGRSEEVMIK